MNSLDVSLTLFMPLVLALHDKKLIDIAELPHYYEDVLARRRLERNESAEATALLEQVIDGLHRLAHQVKAQDQNRPH